MMISDEENITILRREAAQAEQLGKLTDETLAIIYDQDWFKLFVPKVYGGPGKKLPEILRLEEELAYVDGSLAWTVTLCAGAAWFAGFLNPDLAKEIFADRTVCFAGSGAVSGTAMESENGYLVNGTWKYASGALHATIFTANCVLLRAEGDEILDQEGNPKVLSFILKKDEVNILPGWSYFGLIATGSHAFEVVNVEVPKNRTFKINDEIQVADQGFDYPFLQLAETTLVVNSLGMACRFVDLVEQSFFDRSGHKRYREYQVEFFEKEFNNAKHQLLQLKEEFYVAFDQSWNELIADGMSSEASLSQVSSISRQLAHVCWQTVQKLYPYCGLEAAKKETELNRIWRDIHTASQHALLTFLD